MCLCVCVCTSRLSSSNDFGLFIYFEKQKFIFNQYSLNFVHTFQILCDCGVYGVQIEIEKKTDNYIIMKPYL